MKSEVMTASRIAHLYRNSSTLERVTTAAGEPLSLSAQYVLKELKQRLLRGSCRDDSAQLLSLIGDIEQCEGEPLSERERRAVLAALERSLDHYDILTPLIENPAINDIIVSRYDDISVQMGRRNIQTDLQFSSEDAYRSFIEQLLKRAGKSCTTATPVVDAAVDPHIRACVTHESFSPHGQGPFLTLRIARRDRMTYDALIASGMAATEVMTYLRALTQLGQSTLLIAGEVGTGKTTLVRALASSLRSDEALLVIEDTHELMLERPFTRTLITRESNSEGAGRIAPAQAIRAGMRMAMNRVILGEMRDAEAAEAFIDVCASGHPGMSTIHARSARDALHRLELFLLRAQQQLAVEVVRRLIANAISVVVFVGIDPIANRRRILEVVEIATAADGEVQLNPVFRFKREGEDAFWLRESGVSQFAALLSEAEVVLPRVGVRLFGEARLADSAV